MKSATGKLLNAAPLLISFLICMHSYFSYEWTAKWNCVQQHQNLLLLRTVDLFSSVFKWAWFSTLTWMFNGSFSHTLKCKQTIWLWFSSKWWLHSVLVMENIQEPKQEGHTLLSSTVGSKENDVMKTPWWNKKIHVDGDDKSSLFTTGTFIWNQELEDRIGINEFLPGQSVLRSLVVEMGCQKKLPQFCNLHKISTKFTQAVWTFGRTLGTMGKIVMVN